MEAGRTRPRSLWPRLPSAVVHLRASEIAAATDGELFGRDVEVDGASIDSRTISPDQLFVPIVGERDGHDFLPDALAAGCHAYLTSGPILAGTAIRVADTAAALTGLGSHARTRLAGPVIGVTGSVGKTSLKDLLAGALGGTWRTASSLGSFNNEMGVPLTLINAPDGTEVAVVEMGARGVGHIAALCAVARPTVGVVTVVAGAHLEQFGSLDDVARAKGELVEALPADGFAVLNAADPRVMAMAARTQAQVVTFGLGGEVRAEDLDLDAQLRARFRLVSPWGDARVSLAVAGAHQVTNALGAAAAALAVGTPIDAVAQGLAGAHLSALRMDLGEAASGARLLDDSYNASPASMLAALDALVALVPEGSGRRVAVLGTMAELGAAAEAEHAAIGRAAAVRGIEVVAVAEGRFGSSVVLARDVGDAVSRVEALGLGPGDAVLVKASRAGGLERVAAGLRVKR